MIKDKSSEDLNLGVSSMKLNIFEDPSKVKELLKGLIICKTKRTIIIIDDIKVSHLNSIGYWPKNTPIKHPIRKKTLSIIVDLLRQPQPNICYPLIETNIVLPVLHLMQLFAIFRKETSCLMKVLQKARKKKCRLKIISRLLLHQK